MVLTSAERSAINARNRTQHGMRGSLHAVGNENQAELDALRARWATFFDMSDPLLAASVERGLHSTPISAARKIINHLTVVLAIGRQR